MAVSPVSPMEVIAFLTAIAAFLGCIVGVYLLSRRLGMKWIGGPTGHLNADDGVRILKMLWGLEPAPNAGVRKLVWIVRGLWVAFLGLLVASKLLAKGAV